MCKNCERFETDQILFAEDTAMVADSEMMCILLSEFDRVAKGGSCEASECE